MKITILLAGENPDSLRQEFGQYADKFKNMLGDVSAQFSFESIAIHEGADFPSLEGLEGVIITGSAFGVYDNPPWMQPLREFIRKAYAADIAMLGICFGHQIMADALGGKVVKYGKGWSIGRHIYRLKHCPACFLGEPGELAIAASHQDQVISPPPGAEVFLSSDFTANAGLMYENGKAMSLQPHPEFEIAYAAAICDLRRDNPLGDAEVDEAINSLDLPMDNDHVAHALAKFFLQAGKS